MSAFAKRDTEATHKRATAKPDEGEPIFTDLGIICIHVPVETPVAAQDEDDITAPSAEFEIDFDPADDLRPGDRLDFADPAGKVFEHQVSAVRRFSGKRLDYAEADLFRKDWHD